MVYDSNKNAIVLFPSASRFIEAFKLSKKAVTVALKKNRLRNLNGLVFTYTDSSFTVDDLKKIKG